jgi:hypothetical protein
MHSNWPIYRDFSVQHGQILTENTQQKRLLTGVPSLIFKFENLVLQLSNQRLQQALLSETGHGLPPVRRLTEKGRRNAASFLFLPALLLGDSGRLKRASGLQLDRLAVTFDPGSGDSTQTGHPGDILTNTSLIPAGDSIPVPGGSDVTSGDMIHLVASCFLSEI